MQIKYFLELALHFPFQHTLWPINSPIRIETQSAQLYREQRHGMDQDYCIPILPLIPLCRMPLNAIVHNNIPSIVFANSQNPENDGSVYSYTVFPDDDDDDRFPIHIQCTRKYNWAFTLIAPRRCAMMVPEEKPTNEDYTPTPLACDRGNSILLPGIHRIEWEFLNFPFAWLMGYTTTFDSPPLLTLHKPPPPPTTDLGEINVNTLCDIGFDCLQRPFFASKLIIIIIKLGGRSCLELLPCLC